MLFIGCADGCIYCVDMAKFPLRMKDNDLLVSKLYCDPERNKGISITAIRYLLRHNISITAIRYFFPPNAFLRRRRKKALLRVNDRGGGWKMCILALRRVCVCVSRCVYSRARGHVCS